MRRQGIESETDLDMDRATKRISDLFVLAKKGAEDNLVAYTKLGKELCEVKAKTTHGKFLLIAKNATSLGTTQIGVYMALHRHAKGIEEAKAWNSRNAKPAKTNTPEALYKLHARWQKREAPAKLATIIEEIEKNRTILIYNVWAHRSTSKGEVVASEFKLHRRAARKKKSIHAFLKAYDLEVPEYRNFGLDETSNEDGFAPKIVYLGTGTG